MSWHPNGCRLRVSCGTMPKFLETMADRAQSSRKETETRVVEKPSHAVEMPPTGWAALLRGLLCRCPRCGEAGPFSRFLKPVASWARCGPDCTHQQPGAFPCHV